VEVVSIGVGKLDRSTGEPLVTAPPELEGLFLCLLTGLGIVNYGESILNSELVAVMTDQFHSVDLGMSQYQIHCARPCTPYYVSIALILSRLP
jgi:hypothetical protein